MLILTTIYFTDLKQLDSEDARQDIVRPEPDAAESRELLRELLCLYEGRNRVLPIDRNS